MYVSTIPRRSFRGLSATDIGGGILVIPGFNSQTGKYIWQSGDTGTSVAKKFNRPMPDVEWKNMRALNPQTHGRPNEAKWGWEVRIGEEVMVPPQWLADIGWSGEVKPPPGTVIPVESVVISGGVVTPGPTPGTGTGTQPVGPTTPGQPVTVATTKTASMSQYGIYALAALAGLGVAAFLVMRKGGSAPRRSSRPSSRRALPARRSSSRPSGRSRR